MDPSLFYIRIGELVYKDKRAYYICYLKGLGDKMEKIIPKEGGGCCQAYVAEGFESRGFISSFIPWHNLLRSN
jgi:hypothetical protein